MADTNEPKPSSSPKSKKDKKASSPAATVDQDELKRLALAKSVANSFVKKANKKQKTEEK